MRHLARVPVAVLIAAALPLTALAVPAPLRISTPHHAASFDPRGVTFTPAGGAAWQWSLRAVRVGTATIPLADDVAPSQTPGRIDYLRGPLVERYLPRARSVEQQFVLPAPLSLDGRDVTVEGRVRSDAAFTAMPAGWMWGAVSLGRVTVVDARGVQLPARMVVTAATTAITVDGAALRGARYPVTIDPEIGTNDFRVSAVGPDGSTTYDSEFPAAAFNATANEFLVVWQQYDGVENEIYGQRLNGSTGDRLGSSFRISHMGPDGSSSYAAGSPAVAWNSTNNEYLVVWRGDDNSGTLVDDETEIFGQRISAAGVLLLSAFRITNMGTDGLAPVNGGGEADAPAVAYNGTNNEYLVVWQGTAARSTRANNIYGQRVTSAGANVGTHDFAIHAYSNLGPSEYRNAMRPRVAWNSTANEYLVVWAGEDLVDNEVDVFGQRLTGASAALVGTTDFQISFMGPAGDTSYRGDQPDVGYNRARNEYLVVWSGSDVSLAAGEKEIFGQRLTAAAAAAGSNFRISTMGPAGDTRFEPTAPGVRMSGGEYLVVWSSADTTAYATEIYGYRRDGLGGAIGSQIRLSDMGADDTSINFQSGDCALAAGASGMSLVVWRGDDDTAPLVDNERVIFGQLFAGPSTADTTITATPAVIAADGASTSAISVQVKDAGGANMPDAGATVTLSTTAGSLAGLTNHGDGTWSATLTSSAAPATATITGTLNGLPIADNASVEFRFGPPINVQATTDNALDVAVSWSPVSGATAYDVYRAAVIPAYTLLTSTSSTSCLDTTAGAGQAYVYIVRARSATATSALSAPDAATTILFTDASLAGVPVKAVHLSQLQSAVNAMRVAAGLSQVAFSPPTGGTTVIAAADLVALRSALDGARSAIGLPSIGYVDGSLAGATVRAVHFTQLRDGTQ